MARAQDWANSLKLPAGMNYVAMTTDPFYGLAEDFKYLVTGDKKRAAAAFSDLCAWIDSCVDPAL